MLLYILKNEVNEKDIFVDHAGFRTLDTLVRAKEIFQIQDLIFVSQRVYQPRAAFLAKKSVLNFRPSNLIEEFIQVDLLADLENFLQGL